MIDRIPEQKNLRCVTSHHISLVTICSVEEAPQQEGVLQSKLTYLWKEPRAPKEYRAAVSMHGHTSHSREGLSFIGDYAARHPLLRLALATQEREAQTKSAITVDFRRAYWTPPMLPLPAFQLERDQIERGLGLASMISLTDHDNIEAPMLLRIVPEARCIPVSVEWTVPYGDAMLHLGLHNLPAGDAETIMAQLAQYTKSPEKRHLPDLLAMLHEDPDILVVLNHPMWDLAGIGKEKHSYMLHDFMAELGMFIHAFEISGFRSWEENQTVLHLADAWNQIVVGGGDRHGAEPNAVVNLTNAQTFKEFVHEVRWERRCHALLMPQYAEPRALRVLRSVLDAMREYPDYPEGSRRWDERTFHPDRNGVLRPLCVLWDGPPAFINLFFAAMRTLEIAPVRRAMEIALNKPENEKTFALGRGQEAASQWRKTYGSRSFQTRTTKSTVLPTRAGNLRRSRESANSPS